MPPPARRALITGVSGQDGGYLAELLLDQGVEVYGLLRPGEDWSGAAGVARLTGGLDDDVSLVGALTSSRATEVYNLAAVSSVAESFRDPIGTCDITGMGVLRLLEAIRTTAPDARMVQASSSEIFAGSEVSPQRETTPIVPRSPYGVAKAFAHHMVRTYRESRGIFACNAILYTHESPRRGMQFVARRISDGAARISLGLDAELRLGNLDVVRDWGYAPDYVRALELMIRQDQADDYVVATGELHSLGEFLTLAFEAVGLDWHDHVVSDPQLLRPVEPGKLRGDSSRLRARLGWSPTLTFAEMVRMMVEADRERLAATVRDTLV